MIRALRTIVGTLFCAFPLGSAIVTRQKLTGEKNTDLVTAEQLAGLEGKYGGFVKNVVRHVDDTGTDGDPYRIDQGGDRMSNGDGRHGYGETYAKYINLLRSDDSAKKTNVVEVGILKGSGLAMWSELFKGSNIFGFDIDPSNYQSNIPNLQERGYDPANTKVTSLDQTAVDEASIKTALGGERISMLVDDGCHTTQCAQNTFKAFMPYMEDRFVYFIEDGAWQSYMESDVFEFPNLNVHWDNDLAVIFRL